MKKSFRDLVAFQRAKELMLDIYTTTRSFPREELYGLTSQMRRAAISVMANIAEGHGRVTAGEWRQFLSNARGSLFEIEAEFIAARDLGYMPEEQAQSMARKIKRAGTALTGFLNWVRRNETPRNPATQKPSNPNAQSRSSP